MEQLIDTKKIFTKEHIVDVVIGVLILGTVLFWFGSLFLDGSYQVYPTRHSYAADTFVVEEVPFDPAFEMGAKAPQAAPAAPHTTPAQ